MFSFSLEGYEIWSCGSLSWLLRNWRLLRFFCLATKKVGEMKEQEEQQEQQCNELVKLWNGWCNPSRVDATKKGMGCPGVFRMYFVIPNKLRSSLVLKKSWKMKMIPSFYFLLGCIYCMLKCSFMICVGLMDGFSGIHMYIYTYAPEWSKSLSDVINSFFYIPFHPLPSRCILLHSKERSQIQIR